MLFHEFITNVKKDAGGSNVLGREVANGDDRLMMRTVIANPPGLPYFQKIFF